MDRHEATRKMRPPPIATRKLALPPPRQKPCPEPPRSWTRSDLGAVSSGRVRLLLRGGLRSKLSGQLQVRGHILDEAVARGACSTRAGWAGVGDTEGKRARVSSWSLTGGSSSCSLAAEQQGDATGLLVPRCPHGGALKKARIQGCSPQTTLTTCLDLSCRGPQPGSTAGVPVPLS